ncbi:MULTISPECIES: hypothetical protein [Tsukamurella]|uniref:Uncharacterized protein n=2 Tax=Tsukamurella TaxID=2060 RepID=A0A5C5S550_9ACTN|nr:MULTISPECIES: hypothetical protein [Tsukamurella]NMD55181.1 hypothetical protein [Tsukamurella columbiensis]TWS30204.1 hypothetical protein FK530_06755 [Tsukamurella conjunctivitidis]
MNELTPEVVRDELLAGRRVLYVTDSEARDRDALEAIRALLPDHLVRKVSRGYRQHEIECTNGGRVWFVAATTSAARGCQADTLVLDTWREDVRASVLPVLCGAAAPRLFAQRRPLVEEVLGA